MTTNEGTRNRLMIVPWISPIRRPTTSAPAMATYHGSPCSTDSRAMTTAATPLTNPTDRSISPRSRTKTMPMAMTVICAICRSRLTKLRGLRKTGDR